MEDVMFQPKYDGSFNSMVACVAAKYGSVDKAYEKDSKLSMALRHDFNNWKPIGDNSNIRYLDLDILKSEKDWMYNPEHTLTFKTACYAGILQGYLEHFQEDKLHIFERYLEFGQKHPELWKERIL